MNSSARPYEDGEQWTFPTPAGPFSNSLPVKENGLGGRALGFGALGLSPLHDRLVSGSRRRMLRVECSGSLAAALTAAVQEGDRQPSVIVIPAEPRRGPSRAWPTRHRPIDPTFPAGVGLGAAITA
ncbi:hypothetical protein MTBUT4_400034 [Magnetospirillum sp. UT-4]|nr:hypothetical protein MTBUT4_400034 [Magnetospirillum sp. UT-4]